MLIGGCDVKMCVCLGHLILVPLRFNFFRNVYSIVYKLNVGKVFFCEFYLVLKHFNKNVWLYLF